VFRTSFNRNIVIRIIGLLLIIESAFMLTAIPFSLYYGEDDILSILLAAVLTVVTGTIMFAATANKSSVIGKREGYVIVSFTWIIISLFGALPFFIYGLFDNYTDAFFETMSGFTTTGATVLADIESVPKGLLFWRSMTHWLGGMGIIVLTLAILPILGIGGTQLFVAEVPGPVPDKLHPRITGTAKRLWGIYILLTLIQSGLLMLGEMNLFDALCHSFGTMATGGFSTRNASMAAFSPYSQYVVAVFMLLAGMNFSLHYLALHGRFLKVYKNEEFRYYFFVILIAAFIIALALIFTRHFPIEQAIRDSIFQVVSIVTTTGFVTSDYLLWPGNLWFIVFLLFFTGGCAGSTGGGIKSMRTLLLLKNSSLEMKRLVHPNAVIPLRFNGKSVSQDVIYNVLAFFLIYMLIFAAGSISMSFIGLDFQSSLGSVAACLGNIGPGIGSVGPVETYAHIPTAGKWLLSFLMLLGRLELFTVLILLHPAFYRK
jgi:trk system potassium uptake protein